jgi:hypothetical protein
MDIHWRIYLPRALLHLAPLLVLWGAPELPPAQARLADLEAFPIGTLPDSEASPCRSDSPVKPIGAELLLCSG